VVVDHCCRRCKMDNQQEGEKEDRNNKGVRRPRSDGARRPRPASGLPSAPSADDIIASSHPSHDSHKELHSEDLPGAHDRTTERRLGARHSEVRRALDLDFLPTFFLPSRVICAHRAEKTFSLVLSHASIRKSTINPGRCMSGDTTAG
jgi:hypothetical protein